MIFEETSLKGSYIVQLTPKADSRGWFARTYCKEEFAQAGIAVEWVQMNHSFTSRQGTVRGLHYQYPPLHETKLVRCIAGAVFDVIVDIRNGSPTYLQWFGAELSAENKKMILIPEGFAHGFQALTGNAELLYQHSQFYNPGAESGVLYNDARVGIQWPLPVTEVSERDKNFAAIDSKFKPV